MASFIPQPFWPRSPSPLLLPQQPVFTGALQTLHVSMPKPVCALQDSVLHLKRTSPATWKVVMVQGLGGGGRSFRDCGGWLEGIQSPQPWKQHRSTLPRISERGMWGKWAVRLSWSAGRLLRAYTVELGYVDLKSSSATDWLSDIHEIISPLFALVCLSVNWR